MAHQFNFAEIILPADPDDLLQLAQKIIDQHVKKGPYSSLHANQVADLNYKLKCARDKHEEGQKYKKLMEAAWLERDHFLGFGGSSTFGLMQIISQMKTTEQESQENNS
jgi:hypothetical protein